MLCVHKSKSWSHRSSWGLKHSQEKHWSYSESIWLWQKIIHKLCIIQNNSHVLFFQHWTSVLFKSLHAISCIFCIVQGGREFWREECDCLWHEFILCLLIFASRRFELNLFCQTFPHPHERFSRSGTRCSLDYSWSFYFLNLRVCVWDRWHQQYGWHFHQGKKIFLYLFLHVNKVKEKQDLLLADISTYLNVNY